MELEGEWVLAAWEITGALKHDLRLKIERFSEPASPWKPRYQTIGNVAQMKQDSVGLLPTKILLKKDAEGRLVVTVLVNKLAAKAFPDANNNPRVKNVEVSEPYSFIVAQVDGNSIFFERSDRTTSPEEL